MGESMGYGNDFSSGQLPNTSLNEFDLVEGPGGYSLNYHDPSADNENAASHQYEVVDTPTGGQQVWVLPNEGEAVSTQLDNVEVVEGQNGYDLRILVPGSKEPLARVGGVFYVCGTCGNLVSEHFPHNH